MLITNCFKLDKSLNFFYYESLKRMDLNQLNCLYVTINTFSTVFIFVLVCFREYARQASV